MSSSPGNRVKSKSFQYSYHGFTLVELIVVITILVILGTIAFTSISGFSGNARDSSRASDLSNLSKGLDITYQKTDSYPAPDNPFSVTYSGWVLWNQGTISDGVMKTISAGGTRLSRKPTDPLNTAKEYAYSKVAYGNSYQIKADWEGDSIGYGRIRKTLGIESAFASTSNPTISYIKGNYSWIAAKTQTGSTVCILALPSIVSNTGSSATPTIPLETTNLLSGSLLMNGGNLSGTPFKQNLTGSTGAVVYCSGALPSTSSERLVFATALANAYSGTNLATSPQIQPFVQALKNSDTASLTSLGGGVVNGSLGGIPSSVVPQIISTSSTGLVLTHVANNKTFLVSWSGGVNNGWPGGCKLQYRKNDNSWADVLFPATVNCDVNVTNTGVTLPWDGWTGGAWASGRSVRLTRISDSASVAVFPSLLTCSAIADTTTSTPNIDENCNGNWDDVTLVASYGGNTCIYWQHYDGVSNCSWSPSSASWALTDPGTAAYWYAGEWVCRYDGAPYSRRLSGYGTANCSLYH